MLTKKGKYGLKALVHLARLRTGQTVLGSELARANNIPKKFLDAILSELRRDGLVLARKGPGGGYMLARPASRIMLGDVIRVLDGPIAPLLCASRSSYEPCDDCVSVARCAVRIAMLQVRDAMAEVLDHTSLDSMLHGKRGARRLPIDAEELVEVEERPRRRARRVGAA